jgi:alpha-tubulin suppressor-like RCC1 family protein
LDTGVVNCWGDNGFGQLGNDSTADSLVPVAVDPFTDGATAVAIAVGDFHTCAVLNTGAVNCWGYGGEGQLGNNSTADSLVPVAVDPFAVGSASAGLIAAGVDHTCAVLDTGVVNCWGDNGFGQLGNDSTADSLVPVAVDAFTDGASAVSIAAGDLHTCAVLDTGVVNCWGYNADGQLGNDSTADSLAPVAVNAFTDGSTAVSIAAGDYHTCAVLNTGVVNCWGFNGFGQLGNDSTADSLVPVAVDDFTVGSASAVSITVGADHTCAVLDTGVVNCWGDNADGQLGNDSTTESLVPVAVDAFIDGSTAVSIAAGDYHTCALLNTGVVNCWGDNADGQLGNNSTADSSVPVGVDPFTVGSASAGLIAAGVDHTCALLNTGVVNCWGGNADGQLGNNSRTDSLVPVAVDAFTDGASAVSIAAGRDHTCALLNTGVVNCWGKNNFGQLGNNSTETSSVPVKVTSVTVPGVPTAVSATAGNGRATVVWTAPVSDGGSEISGYTVTSSPDNKTCAWTTGELTCVVTGLTNATAYMFTVTATNAAGDSPASTESGAVTPVASVTVPGVPTAVSATAGNGRATVVWTAPVSDGGSEISGYTVTSSPDNKTCTTTGASHLHCHWFDERDELHVRCYFHQRSRELASFNRIRSGHAGCSNGSVGVAGSCVGVAFWAGVSNG